SPCRSVRPKELADPFRIGSVRQLAHMNKVWRLMTLNDRVRAVAFQLLLKTREPVSIATLANELGSARNQVEAEIAQLDAQGLIRRNPGGDVVGSAGLSVVPSRHELHIGDQRFWTWCAYDAV